MSRPTRMESSDSDQIGRRQAMGRLLCGGGGLLAFPALGRGDAAGGSAIVLRATDRAGAPLARGWLGSLYLTDLERTPLRVPRGAAEEGTVTFEPLEAPFAVVMTMPVEGFGTVYLVADNEGRGYAAPGDFQLNVEFAASRLHAVRQELQRGEAAGFVVPDALARELDEAQANLKAARAAEESARRAALAEESLRASLWAGERLVVERARQAIARRGPRPGFLFGCNAFGLRHGERYTRPFTELFNFGTVPFYRAAFEREEGKPDPSRADAITAWLAGAGIATKGHPLTWFHQAGIPGWMRERSFAENRDSTRARCETLARQYAGRIDRWDVINEAHDWANELGYSQEELLELTRVACEGTRAGNPEAQIIVNNCCLFGEYVATGRTYHRQEERPLWTPHQYLQSCIAAGLDFDVIGLQLYYPGYDMFEIDRLLDRFARLGKPIHITELGVSSSVEQDPRAMIQEPSGSHWHAPWSETVQADWIEQFYTVCYGKPAIEAITWWDFADAGHFWPHGGLLRPDFTPKESYGRMKQLLAAWNGSGAARAS